MPAPSPYFEDAAPAEAPEQQPDKEQPDDDAEQTTMANKSAFPDGCKPGDRYEVEIVNVHENEVEFRVDGDSGKEQDKEEAPPEAEAPEESAGGMRSLLED